MSRVLFLAPTVPFAVERGGNSMTWALLDLLSRRHEVHLATFSEDPAEEEHLPALRERCPRVEVVPLAIHRERLGWRYPWLLARSALSRGAYPVDKYRSGRMSRLVAGWVRSQGYRAIHVDHLCMAQFVPAAAPAPVVLHAHNVESQVLERFARVEDRAAVRAFARFEAHKLREVERRACERAAMVWALGPHDRAELERLTLGRARVRVAPMAVDTGYYQPQDVPPVPGRITFVGSMHYRPNVDGAEWFAREVLPRVRREVPGATLRLAGRAPDAALRRLPGVEVTGFVPDVRPEFAQAQAVIVPVRFGGGVKTKTVLGLAMGAAVVATSMGAEGLAVRDGEEALVADEPASLARRVVAVLRDPGLRARLGRAGRELAVRDHSLPVLAAAVERHLAELGAGPAAG